MTIYDETLVSARWKDLKWRKALQVGFRCERCGRRYAGRKYKRLALRVFNLHHRHYDTVGAESLDDVLLLCRTCHRLEHELLSL